MRLFAILFVAGLTIASEIPTTRQVTPMLGQGYQSERQSLVGECLSGKIAYEGSPEASISYTSSISEQQLASELGMMAGAKARLGIMNASASASFLNASKSDAFSISAIYMGTYFFKNRVLKNPKATFSTKNIEHWREACGDEYVSQQTLGAKLFFSIRIDFLSEQEKNAFSSSFSFDAPFVSASASVSRAMASLSKRTKVTVNTLQIGGKVNKITEIFTGKDASAFQFVQCSSGDFAKCQQVLAQAVAYATDTHSGFPSQIGNEPAVLSSNTQSYKSAHIFLELTPELDAQVKLSRKLISDLYEVTHDQYIRAKKLTRNTVMRLSTAQRQRLLSMETTLFNSLQQITEGSLGCFNQPKQCASLYASMPAKLYEEKDFALEPETFSQYCDLGQSPLATKALATSVKSFIQIARSNDSELFTPPYPEAAVDECHAAELSFSRARNISLIGHETPDLRPIAKLGNIETLDMREAEATCPFTDTRRCIKAEYRGHNSFMFLQKPTGAQTLSASTALKNGKILVVGDKISEIFDPKTNQFHQTNPPVIERYYHSLTTLNSGKALVVGGFALDASESAELFNPIINAFEITAKPNFNRAGHTATLLDDGRVLLTGGWSNKIGIFSGFDATPTTEIYDPVTGIFSESTPMHIARGFHRATPLKDGRVLVTGGYTPSGSHATGEIFDPATHSWHMLKVRMHVGRSEHTANQLPDGRVLIAGGFTAKAEIFCPKTESFTLISDMNDSRGEHEALVMSDGKVAIFGGRTHNNMNSAVNSGGDEALKTAEIFDPDSGLFTRITNLMNIGRTMFSLVPTGKHQALLVGGLGQAAAHSAELFEYTTL